MVVGLRGGSRDGWGTEVKGGRGSGQRGSQGGRGERMRF